MKFLFYQLFLFLSILINSFQCQNPVTQQYIFQKLYDATNNTVLSLMSPICSQILFNVNGIQSQYISANGLSGRVLPLGTFLTQVLALEYLYALLCPIPNFPPPDYVIQTYTLKSVAYNKDYLITQNEFIVNLTGNVGNVQLSFFAGMAFDQDYKLCAYDGQVRNPGLTFDTYTDLEHQTNINTLCGAAQLFCNGSLQQYDSVSQCVQFLMTNVSYGSYDRGDQGNFVCRLIHIKFVPLLPSVHCPHVGPTGGGACTDKTAESYYDSPDFLSCAYKYSQDLVLGGD